MHFKVTVCTCTPPVLSSLMFYCCLGCADRCLEWGLFLFQNKDLERQPNDKAPLTLAPPLIKSSIASRCDFSEAM